MVCYVCVGGGGVGGEQNWKKAKDISHFKFFFRNQNFNSFILSTSKTSGHFMHNNGRWVVRLPRQHWMRQSPTLGHDSPCLNTAACMVSGTGSGATYAVSEGGHDCPAMPRYAA